MKTKKRIIKNITLVTGLAAAAITFAGCGGGSSDATTTAASGSTTAQESSKETKRASLEVVNSKGESKRYEDDTDAQYLRGFMDQLQAEDDFTYTGTESASGIFIDSVNGESANYTTDGAYWAIYVNGEYGNSGADSQTVKDGDEFKLVYEKAQ